MSGSVTEARQMLGSFGCCKRVLHIHRTKQDAGSNGSNISGQGATFACPLVLAGPCCLWKPLRPSIPLATSDAVQFNH
eukprot:6343692-Amphidinium_carterae.1